MLNATRTGPIAIGSEPRPDRRLSSAPTRRTSYPVNALPVPDGRLREPIDVVYTWVDGAWPGYADLLSAHATSEHDRNPNRYRDNLELLKFSLRALERFAPWVRNVHLVTMRPQVPRWLAQERVKLVHHDAFLGPEHLPTFNSFAIVSNLVKLPDLSTRFLYMEDDRLFMRNLSLSDFVDADGKLRLYQEDTPTPRGRERARSDVSPWNLALAQANHLLNQRYGRVARKSIKRAPLFIDRELFDQFSRTFPEALEHNRQSRFRARGNVAVEHMYPYFLWHEGLASPASPQKVRRDAGYLGLERFAAYNAVGLALLAAKRPKFLCLNDNFGHNPKEAAVRVVRRFLERAYPVPSRFERD